MRDKWYADNRDLVKWGALVHLAQKYGIQRIVQVAYYRADAEMPKLNVDNQPPVDLPSSVWNHFRNLKLIHSLSEDTHITIDVLNDPFEKRFEYHRNILNKIKSYEDPKIVFLDPDTGLAPKNAKLEHVLEEELRDLWNSLRTNDWLVLYQHEWRKKGWNVLAKERFQKVCNPSSAFHNFTSEKLASDVVLLCAKRDS